MEPRGSMKAPLRVYGTRRIVEELEETAVQQGMNVASLPGIVKYSIMLPDAHQGYGFPIGGVAAFDVEEGVISPGGVGFDINCLPPGTKVLHPLGYTRSIEELLPGDRVVLLNDNHARPVDVGFVIEDRRDVLLELKTLSGKKLVLSKDHPILTPSGFKKAEEDLNLVALYPFEGVPYEEPRLVKIVEDLEERYAKELEEKGLFPLTSLNEKFPILLRFFGYMLGDGIVSRKYLVAYGDEETLKEIGKDVLSLGFKPLYYERERVHDFRGRTFRTVERSLRVNSRALAELFWAMGYPRGRKSRGDWRLPSWIFELPLWQKRLFLSGFFSAEMSSPKTMNGYNFYMPEVKHSRDDPEAALRFLEDIGRLLDEFGIRYTIKKSEEYKDRHIYKLLVHEDPENLRKLFGRIGFDYNVERRRRALAAIVFLGWKEHHKEKRRTLRKIAKELGRKALHELKGVNRRFIERSLYEDTEEVRISKDFIDFETFLNEFTEGDVVYDVVVEKKEVPHFGEVYDLSVLDDHHNFVAEGFVVSNCGVRVVLTNLTEKEVRPKLKELVDVLFRNVPAGLGSEGRLRLSRSQLEEVMTEGVFWAVEMGYGWEEDPEHIEENGRMEGADPSKVSSTAVKRGAPQLGTLGSGNHFLEIQRVEKVFDPDVAEKFGLFKDQVVVMIHTGSRGFGHQIASDYLKVMERAMRKYGIHVPDKQLASVPFNSPEAQDYFAAMKAAVNFAFTNRQLITHWVRESFGEVFKEEPEDLGMRVLYDVAHNIAKVERHGGTELVVHRKGATRAFAPGRKEIPKAYRQVGQPVLIPGSMGTASYILVGTHTAMDETFGSTCHGAGRVLSRTAAKKRWRGEEIQRILESMGKAVRAVSYRVLAEEAPEAYKDVDEVIRSVDLSGISRPVSRNVPLGVVKG